MDFQYSATYLNHRQLERQKVVGAQTSALSSYKYRPILANGYMIILVIANSNHTLLVTVYEQLCIFKYSKLMLANVSSIIE